MPRSCGAHIQNSGTPRPYSSIGRTSRRSFRTPNIMFAMIGAQDFVRQQDFEVGRRYASNVPGTTASLAAEDERWLLGGMQVAAVAL